MSQAQVNVVSEPNRSQPTSPILAKEHTNSANECEDPKEKNPKYVLFIWVGGVVDQAHDADSNGYPADNCDGKGTFVHPIDA